MEWEGFSEKVTDFVGQIFGIKDKSKSIGTRFVQYIHKSRCNKPCEDCVFNDARVFESDDMYLPKVGNDNHYNCDCDYMAVQVKKVGTISKMGLNAPDVHLKAYGRLPEYYITKREAQEVYGWKNGKNTILGKAPGKMLGGDVYRNECKKLPIKEGRIWYECDVDYDTLKRNSYRLFYSNDGLMFYSDDHGQKNFYFVD